MSTQHIQAIFEAGKLLPLEPLNLAEHERVEISVTRSAPNGGVFSGDFASLITDDADDTVTLQQVQQALSKIPGSLVDDFASERDERF